jgi:hypothetical protein
LFVQERGDKTTSEANAAQTEEEIGMSDHLKPVQSYQLSPLPHETPTIWTFMPNRDVNYYVIKDGSYYDLEQNLIKISNAIGSWDIAIDHLYAVRLAPTGPADQFYIMTTEQFEEFLKMPRYNRKGEAANGTCPDCGGPAFALFNICECFRRCDGEDFKRYFCEI